jgi:hypothetical protein
LHNIPGDHYSSKLPGATQTLIVRTAEEFKYRVPRQNVASSFFFLLRYATSAMEYKVAATQVAKQKEQMM